MSYDVFISYSNKNKAIADAVCAKLEENKIRVWIAPRDVLPGKDFAASIIHAIDNCRVFVLIWSEESNKSGHILNEINRAFSQNITVLPFRIDNVEPTESLEYYIGRTHWLDAITPPLEKHIEKLVDTILSLIGRENDLGRPLPVEDSRQIHKAGSKGSPGIPAETRSKINTIGESHNKAKPKKTIMGLVLGGILIIALIIGYIIINAQREKQIPTDHLISPATAATPTRETLKEYVQWPLVLWDSFDSNANYWPEYTWDSEYGNGTWSVQNGVYHYEANAVLEIAGGDYPYAIENIDFSGFYLAMDVKQVAQAYDTGIGFGFRAASDGETKYMFFINQNGEIKFVKTKNTGEWISLLPTLTSKVNSYRDGNFNHLTVVHQNTHFIIYINGDKVVDTYDAYCLTGKPIIFTTLSAGYQGIYEFDNFELRAP
jgi:hypothetical protein